jgi:hypothetical protein
MSASSDEISSQHFRHKNGYFATLTAENYSTWCESMKNVLQGKGFWLIIEEEEHRPPNAPHESDDALIAGRTAAQQAFDVKYRECVSMLKSACSPTIRPYISCLDCPIQIWEMLERKLGGSNTVHTRLALIMKFNSLKPKDGEPLEEYFAKLIDIRNQLHDSPAAIMDTQFTSHILQSMPSYLSVTVQFCFLNLKSCVMKPWIIFAKRPAVLEEFRLLLPKLRLWLWNLDALQEAISGAATAKTKAIGVLNVRQNPRKEEIERQGVEREKERILLSVITVGNLVTSSLTTGLRKKRRKPETNVLGMRKRRTQMKVIDGKDRHLWSLKC